MVDNTDHSHPEINRIEQYPNTEQPKAKDQTEKRQSPVKNSY